MTAFLITILFLAATGYVFTRIIALLIIDMQNGFTPGGELGVKEGDVIIPIINRLTFLFTRILRALVVFSRDWHPLVSKHFKKFGGAWETHCVVDTYSAEFHKDLLVPENANILSKGLNEDDQAYSAFDKNARIHGMDLATYLRKKGIKILFVTGLATDWCVKETVLDARKNGFWVFVITSAMRPVNLNPGDEERAIKEMRAAGAIII
jgi:nicotinamidase/pyrazinamidase